MFSFFSFMKLQRVTGRFTQESAVPLRVSNLIRTVYGALKARIDVL